MADHPRSVKLSLNEEKLPTPAFKLEEDERRTLAVHLLSNYTE
jgi:hypothetical protein